MPKHLHIICLNVPFPVDYGGVYDLFYKLPALQQQGISIHLHCFEYGRGHQKELDQYCETVNYYKRNEPLKSINYKLPYIVASRRSNALLTNLLKDDYPILMEGIHCTYPLLDGRFANRKMYVRLHNTEYQYYSHLYRYSNQVFKKIYYLVESILLKKYERRIAKMNNFFAVSYTDVDIYKKQFKSQHIQYLPLFLPPWQVHCKEGMGAYCLYHGNLQVEENEKAAIWLLQHVFKYIDLPLVIAGKNPSARLIHLAANTQNTKMVANASNAQMQQLIADAHVHVLPSFNATGIKIKLLNALYNGRHIVVNTAGVEGTDLNEICHIADTPEATQQLVEQLYHQPFTKQETDQRRQTLLEHFNNEKSAKALVKEIFG